ncbi:MAG: alkaline phosphatase [Beijerinckiaceae bacterium]|nr:alkaline phosphatase [Beijerinckiaceae bacterium]
MQFRLKTSSRFGLAILALWATSAVVAPAFGEEAKIVQTDDAYFKDGEANLARILQQQPNTKRAKNVILFVGDGFGVATMTAARIFEGQQRGVDGVSNLLSFEKFPHAALSRTYAHDSQVTDSAPSAGAMLTGVKMRNNMEGVRGSAEWRNCGGTKGKEVTTLAEVAKSIGMSAGAVSTARITDATPAALYSHSANRLWESDADLSEEAVSNGCIDIARQLVEMKYGDGLDVMLGGGRFNFLPATMADPEYADRKGKRKDGRDLTADWLKRYSNSGAYVWNLDQFKALNPKNQTKVLGLFEPDNMKFDFDRPKDKGGEPELADMTTFAIDAMSSNPNGYFLMVEGGRIDHGSHANNAYRTLTDAVAFDKAIKAALAKVNLDETLIIVTADHSHALTMNGYPDRDNPILGLVKEKGKLALGLDGKPYTTLGYANGPGGLKDGVRADLKSVDTTDPDFIQQALVPLTSETHAGEDVAIFAAGPWAHLFQGSVEESYIYQVMNHALQASARLEGKK